MKRVLPKVSPARKARSGRAAPVEASRPRPRRPEARPDEILDAALAAFSEKGFDAARMDDVAAEAGLSKAGIYLYFPSKDALLEALIEREVAPVAERIRALSAAGMADPAATLRAVMSFAAGNLLNGRVLQVPRLVIAVSNRFPQITERYRTRVIDVALSGAEALFAAGVTQGAFRTLPPRALVRAFIGPILFEALYAHVMKGGSPFEIDAIVAQHFDILFNGIAAEKAA